MGVLHVITNSNWGGAQGVVNQLCLRSTFDCSVACGGDGRLIQELRGAGINVYEIPDLKSPPGLRSDYAALRDLLSVMKRNQFDLVHCHSTKAGALGRVAGRLTGHPVVFTVHGWGFKNDNYQSIRPLIEYGERLLESLTEEIVCVSRDDLRHGINRGILSESNARVIHNGIPATEPECDHSLTDIVDISEDDGTVGAIARLTPAKNPLQILRVAEKIEGIQLVLIGDGPLRAECERYIEKNDLSNVHMLGFVENEVATAYLQEFDVFLLPSQFEGFPLTVLESFRAGVPVVGYDVGGVAELVTDDETGYLVEQGQFEQFVVKVDELLSDRTTLERMGAEARDRFAGDYTAEEMARRYDELYDEILY